MSDQYIPNKPRPSPPGTEPYRSSLPGDVPSRAPVVEPTRSFSSGMLVAAILVIVAIFAIVMLSSRDAATPVGGSDITIDNSATPLPDAAEPVVPDATVPATPDAGTLPDTGTLPGTGATPVAPDTGATPAEPAPDAGAAEPAPAPTPPANP
jgi:hypothetical protein